MLTASNGAQYIYDALQQQVAKIGGSHAGEVVYFGGRPMALYNPASGAWTDMIWAGGNLLGYVALTLLAYIAANDLFSFFWDMFSGPQFTGSLVPRPADLSGLGTSSIGIPNQNLSIQGIMGHSQRGVLQSPGLQLPGQISY